MLFSLSAAIMMSCQSCPAVEQSGYTHEFTLTPEDGSPQPGPVIRAESLFESGEISSKSFIGDDVAIQPAFAVKPGRIENSYRMSSSDAVAGFEAGLAAQRRAQPVRDVRRLDAEVAFEALGSQTGLGFDVGVAPRLKVREEGEFERRSFGGELRIGQNFDQRGTNARAESWYLFAGADGEALVWDPGAARSIEGMALRDQVTVGDMQAGVSFQRGAGQVSFAYIRRDVSYSDKLTHASESEDFAGLSFTIRR